MSGQNADAGQVTQSASIDYKLGQYGWSSFDLTIGAASVNVGEFGYCSDALGDLVRAALMIATSADYAEVSFDGEPQEWRLILDERSRPTVSLPEVRIRVLVFPDASPRSPEEQGNTIFEARCTVDAVAGAVQAAAQTVWDQYGAEGYNKAWLPILNGFPLRAMHALSAALSTQEPLMPSTAESRKALP
jgi:hypothetical protein